jgi:hypothetical protein
VGVCVCAFSTSQASNDVIYSAFTIKQTKRLNRTKTNDSKPMTHLIVRVSPMRRRHSVSVSQRQRQPTSFKEHMQTNTQTKNDTNKTLLIIR